MTHNATHSLSSYKSLVKVNVLLKVDNWNYSTDIATTKCSHKKKFSNKQTITATLFTHCVLSTFVPLESIVQDLFTFALFYPHLDRKYLCWFIPCHVGNIKFSLCADICLSVCPYIPHSGLRSITQVPLKQIV